MTKAIIIAALLAGSATAANAQYYNNNRNSYGSGYPNPNSHYVQPHMNNNGGFTGGHYRTNPDNNPFNNYSSEGNTNPYTGQRGTKRTPLY